jgi:DNA polymerase/3'-5' exonuclease PolX
LNRSHDRSISVAFPEPNLYALGWINHRCHGYAVFGASLQHFAGSPHLVRTLNAASGIGVASFGAWGQLQAL